MGNTTLFVMIDEKEIVYSRSETYLDNTNRIITDMERKFWRNPTSKNFKDIIYLKIEEKVDDFKTIEFNLGELNSGTLIFDLNMIQKDNYFSESVVIFNALDIAMSLRSSNYHIDGKLVSPKTICTHLTLKALK